MHAQTDRRTSNSGDTSERRGNLEGGKMKETIKDIVAITGEDLADMV